MVFSSYDRPEIDWKILFDFNLQILCKCVNIKVIQSNPNLCFSVEFIFELKFRFDIFIVELYNLSKAD